MTTRTASIGRRWYVGVDDVNGAAKLHVDCVDNDLIVGFECWCGWFVNLQMQQCD